MRVSSLRALWRSCLLFTQERHKAFGFGRRLPPAPPRRTSAPRAPSPSGLLHMAGWSACRELRHSNGSGALTIGAEKRGLRLQCLHKPFFSTRARAIDENARIDFSQKAPAQPELAPESRAEQEACGLWAWDPQTPLFSACRLYVTASTADAVEPRAILPTERPERQHSRDRSRETIGGRFIMGIR